MKQDKNLTLLEKKVLQQMKEDMKKESSESLQKKLSDELEKLTTQAMKQIVSAKDELKKCQLALYCLYTENKPMFGLIMKWEFLYDYQKEEVGNWMEYEALEFVERLVPGRYDFPEPLKIKMYLLKNNKVVDFETLEKEYRKRHGY